MSVAERISSDVSRLTRDFGESFRCTDSDGKIRTITAIFDDAFELSKPGGYDFADTGPAATAQTSAVEDYQRGNTFERVSTGDIFYFLKRESDSHGLSIVYLSKDEPHG
jgi:hypothetical protein